MKTSTLFNDPKNLALIQSLVGTLPDHACDAWQCARLMKLTEENSHGIDPAGLAAAVQQEAGWEFVEYSTDGDEVWGPPESG